MAEQNNWELLATDPDWKCPCCGWMNLPVRNYCRNCGCDGGEFGFHEGDLKKEEVTNG